MFDAELYLRLTGERLMLDESRTRQPGFSSPLVHSARALVAAGAIELDAAREVLDDYQAASALRLEGFPPSRLSTRKRPRAPKPFPPRRVVACDQRIEQQGSTLHVRYVMLSKRATKLGVTQRFASSGRRGSMVMAHGAGPSAMLADDRGTTVASTFSGGGSDVEWHGHLTAGTPLHPDTAWIEVDGVRIELADELPAIEVTVEPLPEQDPAWGHLWCSVAVPDRMHDRSGSVELAIEALLAAGVIESNDPRLDELRAIVDRFSGGSVPGRRGRRIPKPWRSLRSYGAFSIVRQGEAVLGAVTPLFDGITVAVTSLLASEEGFSLEVETRPDVSGGPFHLSLDSPQVAWWARDDIGNHYLGDAGSWGSSDDHGSGTILFEAGLDPKAKRLELMPTGPTERAVIVVPLDLLRGADE